MSKLFPIGVVLVIVALVAAFVLSQSSNNSSLPAPMPSAEAPSDQITNAEAKYIQYSTTALSGNEGKRRVLFFYANWCPTCRPDDAQFTQNADQIPDNVVLIRVNYNDSDTDAEEKALADKYQITYQHTFVQIDESAEAVTRWNGGQMAELLANIK